MCPNPDQCLINCGFAINLGGVGVSSRPGREGESQTIFTKNLLTVAGSPEQIFPDPRYGLLPWGLLQFLASTLPLEFLDFDW